MNLSREAFLRRIEDREVPKPSDRATRFLLDAGLDATPIDSASLEMLEEILKDEDSNAQKRSGYSSSTQKNSVTETDVFPMDSTTNFPVKGALSRDDLILQQLKQQTEMILEMQRRIDYLTTLVHHGTSGSPPWASRAHPSSENRSHPNAEMDTGIRAPHHAAPALEVTPMPRQPPRRRYWDMLHDYVKDLSTRIRNSRAQEFCRVFSLLFRRYVRLEGALFFKVILMVSIMAAKILSRPQKENAVLSNSFKFNLLMMAVLLGFMIRSGYYSFCYYFFVKDRIFQRIYHGEIIDVDQINWDMNHLNHQNNNNNNLRNVFQRNRMFLGGAIPAPRNGITVLVDFAILIGSFILSLLPMWRADGQLQERQDRMMRHHLERQPVAPPNDMNQYAADENEDEDGDDDDDDSEEGNPHEHQD
jgi:hypothetical protein